MTILEKILQVTKRLYPTGRAFRMHLDSWKMKLHEGLAVSENQAYNDAMAILSSVLPDNSDFNEDDARQWEVRLGLITNEAVAIEDRKAAIRRKYNHPGTVPDQQHYRYLEKQLQDAGFNVYVHENIFDDGFGGTMTRTPEDVTGMSAPPIEYGDAQYGDFQYGGTAWDKVVNYMNPDLDRFFNVGSNLRFTFFIGGAYVGDFAAVDANRMREFRQIILKAKPANMVAYLFINYTTSDGIFDDSYDDTFE